MSVLPKVAGQSLGGDGLGSGLEVASDCRYASIAEQSAALRASFQTATPKSVVAAT